jgi:acetate kinase (EC 2.7.2.1)
MKILVLNAGSSTLKSCLYELNDVQPDRPPQPLWSAQIDWTHQQGIAELKVKTATGDRLEEEFASESRTDAISRMLETLWQGKTQTINDLTEIDIVGHRVVHGGQEYQQSTLISPDVKEAIARLSVFAPVHNPVNLEGIEAIENILGNVPQIAVFDTAFHAQLPPAAFVIPVLRMARKWHSPLRFSRD